jgi:hypothetical protein
VALPDILASQLPVENWHDYGADPIVADALLDRVLHNAHRIKLKGASTFLLPEGLASRPRDRDGSESTQLIGRRSSRTCGSGATFDQAGRPETQASRTSCTSGKPGRRPSIPL